MYSWLSLWAAGAGVKSWFIRDCMAVEAIEPKVEGPAFGVAAAHWLGGLLVGSAKEVAGGLLKYASAC